MHSTEKVPAPNGGRPCPISTVANVTRTSGSALGVSGCGSTAAIASGSVS